ncbi:MAG: SRPBCC family protein, partial [Ktedonobacterales bacterium]|nr:SRPBCC family protein [Ktedonobacterales bacterium]
MAQTTPMEQTGKRLVFEDSIEVQAPIQEVYRRWSDFTRFPDFMSNVEEVKPQGENRYHWVARIFGIKQEWDAEITDREQNHRIAWRSLSGPHNQGTVTFQDSQNGHTQVRLRLE